MEAELDINAVVATADGDPINVKDSRKICVNDRIVVKEKNTEIEKKEVAVQEDVEQNKEIISKEEDGMIV